MLIRARVFLICLLGLTAVPAVADYTKVSDKSEFVALMSGKHLTRPLVNLRVTDDGRIEGTGARWDVTGNWSWRDGYFCRDLNWGGDDIGYNCQEVRVNGPKVRFTSDRGAGPSAVFRLKE